MSALPKTTRAAAEYLATERAAETKGGFSGGEMFAAAGTTKNHAGIAVDLSREFSARLPGRACEPFAVGRRVESEADGPDPCPDLAVACGERAGIETGNRQAQ